MSLVIETMSASPSEIDASSSRASVGASTPSWSALTPAQTP